MISRLDRFLLFVVCLDAFYLLAWGADMSGMIDAANMIGPLLLGIASTYTAYQLVKTEGLVVWTPYFWFLGGIVLYFSLGPLAYVYGSDELIAHLHRSLPIHVSQVDLLMTNLLNSVGIGSILIGVRLGWMMLPFVKGDRYRVASDVNRLSVLAFWMLAIGGSLQFLLVLPWEFGAYDFVLPGIVFNLSKIFIFGIMILAYVAAKGKRRWRPLLYVLWGIQFFVALIHFSKTEVMVTMLLPTLGIYLANRNLKWLIGSIFVMALVYVAIAQMVHFGRYEVTKLSVDGRTTINQRLEITRQWIEGQLGDNELYPSDISPLETGWARLSYSNVQSFAMSQYDEGLPGDTLAMVAYVLIPRIIWPEKPITTDMSIDFYELVTGWRGETHLGLGIFGEGYWNMGWTGVVVLGLISGLVFWFVGVYASSWMRQGRMEYLPSIFLGIMMGLLGTTQFFANAIVGGGAILLVYALVVSKAFSMIVARK